MGAEDKIPDRYLEIESLVSELHDAIGRALALIVAASALSGMARVGPLGLDHLRRLVLEAESAMISAYEHSRRFERIVAR
jgi:hypothetical protein